MRARRLDPRKALDALHRILAPLSLLLLLACGGEPSSPPAPPGPDASVVAAVRRGLKADTITERRQAALRATEDPALAAALVPELAEAMGDESHWVATPAAEALDLAGPAAIEVLPALMDALSHPADYVRWRAAKILAGLGPDAREALPLLERNAEDPSETEIGRHWAQAAVRRVRGE